MTSNARNYASEQSWRQLQTKLKSLPEKVRRKQVNKILVREARPLVWAARKAAYADSTKPAGVRKKELRKGDGPIWYNLFKTIDAYPNKKSRDYQYVVVGTRKVNKTPRGALYAQWQNLGGMGPGKGFKAKAFFNKAEQESADVVSAKALRAVNKEIEQILRSTFR